MELLVIVLELLKVRNNDKECNYCSLLGVTTNESIGSGVTGCSTRTTKSKI